MKKENRLIRQQTIYWALLLVAAMTIALFETGLLPKGGLECYDGTIRYIIDTAVFMLTIGLIPLAAKKFDKSIEKVKTATTKHCSRPTAASRKYSLHCSLW